MGFRDATHFWNARFDQEEFIFGKEPNDYLVEQSTKYLKSKNSVLSIADGEGRNGVWLAKQGMHVTAFDISELAVTKAKQLAKDNQVQIQYRLCDIDSFDWRANQYDAVIAIFIQFANPAMRARIFNQIQLALKSGGLLILQGYTAKQLEYKTGGPSLIEHLYTEEMIRDLAKELEILDLRCYEQEIFEGVKHDGMSALLGLTARKH
jgi:cyclopropane fatty-acyl-phospholipid synthase-like methyltransferase